MSCGGPVLSGRTSALATSSARKAISVYIPQFLIADINPVCGMFPRGVRRQGSGAAEHFDGFMAQVMASEWPVQHVRKCLYNHSPSPPVTLCLITSTSTLIQTAMQIVVEDTRPTRSICRG